MFHSMRIPLFSLILLADCHVSSTILLLIHSILHHFISGHAKIIDKFLSDPRANYNDAVVKDKIFF
jgi:hypothetical protein